MLIGILLQTAGFISASYASQVWHLYLSQGVLLGVGLGFIFVPCTPILSQWFSKIAVSQWVYHPPVLALEGCYSPLESKL